MVKGSQGECVSLFFLVYAPHFPLTLTGLDQIAKPTDNVLTGFEKKNYLLSKQKGKRIKQWKIQGGYKARML